MSKISEKRQYKIIRNAISILTTLCCADTDKTIDLLTGYLWSEEEAGQIKQQAEGISGRPDKG